MCYFRQVKKQEYVQSVKQESLYHDCINKYKTIMQTILEFTLNLLTINASLIINLWGPIGEEQYQCI